MAQRQGKKKIVIGADHAGYEAKEKVKAWLLMRGYEVADVGTDSVDSVDYPDYARKVAAAVSDGKFAKGVLICGTGLGMSYAANRFPKVRAALCWSAEVAELARDHNDANILVLPGRVETLDPLDEILGAWLERNFSGEERHLRRIGKIDARD